jgi:hypothetical protein
MLRAVNKARALATNPKSQFTRDTGRGGRRIGLPESSQGIGLIRPWWGSVGRRRRADPGLPDHDPALKTPKRDARRRFGGAFHRSHYSKAATPQEISDFSRKDQRAARQLACR